MSSLVNHPSHYSKEGRKECIEEMLELYGEHITAIFCLTNSYKYIYRAGEKDGNSEKQDMQKARWYYEYAKRIIDRKDLVGRFRDLYDYIKYRTEEYWIGEQVQE